MEERNKPNYWLKEMRSLRDDWEDQIPARILHSDSGIKSNARKSWFVGIRANGEEIRNFGWMSEGSWELYQDYVKHYEIEWVHRNTKPEDIEQGNKVLDHIIQDLERA